MKKIKVFLMAVLMVLAVQICAVSVSCEVQAATATTTAAKKKTGLYKEKGLYYYYVNGKKIKIGNCKKINLNICGVLPGTIINVTKKSFCVSCASGSALEILMLQPEGKKMMNTEDYLKGNKTIY